MEINNSFGDHTQKVFLAMPDEGIVIDTKNTLNKEQIRTRLTQFLLEGQGVRRIPSGELRQAAIRDVIEETRKEKMQDSLRYLEDTSKNNKGCSINYDPDTGRIGDFELNKTETVLKKVNIRTDSARDKEWIKGVSMQTIEIEFGEDKQITNVTFITNGVDKNFSKVGITKSQIKVMTVIMEHNKKHWKPGSVISKPQFEVKDSGVRIDNMARSENFFKALVA